MLDANINLVFQKMCYDCNSTYISEISHHSEDGVLVFRNPKYLTEKIFELPHFSDKNRPLRPSNETSNKLGLRSTPEPCLRCNSFLGLNAPSPDSPVSVRRSRRVIQKEQVGEKGSKKTQPKQSQ